MQAPTEKNGRLVILTCAGQTAQAIVQPIIKMSLMVLDMSHATKRQTLTKHAEELLQAKRLLVGLLESKLSRPFWAERLSNFQLTTNPLLGGYFDLQFTEHTPSKEGPVASVHRVRLVGVDNKSLQDRFVAFINANNPGARQAHDLAQQMIQAAGL